jgi:hypothetical protein
MNGLALKPTRLRGPAVALAWEICRAQRGAFLALAGALLVCAGWQWFRFATRAAGQFFENLCIPIMGLSLAASFVLFRFTESDRRGRFNGFPSRLFTMPVRTVWLVTLPMLYGAATVVLVYAAWAVVIFRAAGPGHFALGFPSLYLATGMICFQALVWSLAGFPITRLVGLGVWGAALTTSWIAFSPLMGGAQLGAAWAAALHVSVRTAQAGLLLMVSFAAYGLAWWSVSRQRRGLGLGFAWPRLFRLPMLKLERGNPARFGSVRAAQFWFEWRRNGMVLPLLVGVLLMIIVTPFFVLCPFLGRAEPATLMLTLFWILVLPFVLAFIIGQGFGKTNFWGQGLGQELGVPLFLAVRPLSAADWLAVKLKTAAVSAALTWGLVGCVVPVWLATCCDWGQMLPVLLAIPLSLWLPGAAGLAALLLALAMLVTWRLLAANLYLGVLGNKWLYNAAFCFVLLAIFGVLVFGAWSSGHQRELAEMKMLLPWVAGFLAALVLLKLGLAVFLFRRAKQRGLLPRETALGYFAVWIWATALLLFLVALAPVTDTTAQVFGLLAILAFPLVRIFLAPLAFGRSRVQ